MTFIALRNLICSFSSLCGFSEEDSEGGREEGESGGEEGDSESEEDDNGRGEESVDRKGQKGVVDFLLEKKDLKSV